MSIQWEDLSVEEIEDLLAYMGYHFSKSKAPKHIEQLSKDPDHLGRSRRNLVYGFDRQKLDYRKVIKHDAVMNLIEQHYRKASGKSANTFIIDMNVTVEARVPDRDRTVVGYPKGFSVMLGKIPDTDGMTKDSYYQPFINYIPDVDMGAFITGNYKIIAATRIPAYTTVDACIYQVGGMMDHVKPYTYNSKDLNDADEARLPTKAEVATIADSMGTSLWLMGYGDNLGDVPGEQYVTGGYEDSIASSLMYGEYKSKAKNAGMSGQYGEIYFALQNLLNRLRDIKHSGKFNSVKTSYGSW